MRNRKQNSKLNVNFINSPEMLIFVDETGCDRRDAM